MKKTLVLLLSVSLLGSQGCAPKGSIYQTLRNNTTPKY